MTTPRHLSPEEFRELSARMADAIARYWERLEQFPVLSRVQPGDVKARLPDAAPERGEEDWAAIFADVESVVLPGLTHWQAPTFHAFFPANASFPAILGEFLAAGLGVQGMLWATSPACTEIETRVLDWVGRALALPGEFLSTSPNGGGVLQGTASEGVLSALVAARRRVVRENPRRGGLTIYASTQAHSCVVKAAMVAGLAESPEDRTHVRLIETDGAYAMDAAALARVVRADVEAGRTPTFVCATVGTTSSTAIDDVGAIARALREGGAARAWLHVDAAHAGSACICPEFRWMLDGLEHADSFGFNPHKHLLTNFDCHCFYTRDRRGLIDSMSVTPEYLRNQASESGEVFDYRDWHVPLGRRFRALKLWFVLRHYGLEGLRGYIREHVRLAGLFEGWVREDARFEVATPRTLDLVCFRPRPGAGEAAKETDARAKALLDAINASGEAYLTHTVLPATRAAPEPRLVLRMCVGATTTQERHVRETWELIRRLAG